MTEYICKCGKKFNKSTTAATTGYVLTDFSEQHKCYGCPYIVVERDWKTHEITKRECRATLKEISYLSHCKMPLDHTMAYLYSLDISFAKRVFSFMNTLDGTEKGGTINRVPDEWRAADYDENGLIRYPLLFKKNKSGIEARKAVMERFFNNDGTRKRETKVSEKGIILQRISIAIDNAKAEINHEVLQIPIDDLDLSIRTYNALKRAGINTVGDFENNKEKMMSLIGKEYMEVNDKLKTISPIFAEQQEYLEVDENGGKEEMGKIDFTALKNKKKAAEEDIVEDIPEQLERTYTEVWGNSNEKVVLLETGRIEHYTDTKGNDQPFKLNQKKISQIVASAKDIGIVSPLLVRKKGDNYQVYVGHHRLEVAKKLGFLTVPCIVRNEENEEKVFKVVAESNIQRDKTLPSEYGKIFTKYMEVRQDINITAQEIADKFGVSKKTMYRYINVMKLIPELIALVDNEVINIGGVDSLSTLSENVQKALSEAVNDYDVKVSVATAKRIKDYCEAVASNDIDSLKLFDVISEKSEKKYNNKIYNKLHEKYKFDFAEKDLDELTEHLLEDYLNGIS